MLKIFKYGIKGVFTVIVVILAIVGSIIGVLFCQLVDIVAERYLPGYIGTTIFVVAGIISIYIKWFKPMNKYQDYIERAKRFETYLRNRKKAIQILLEAIQNDSLNKYQKVDILFNLSKLLLKEHNWYESKKYIDQALEILTQEDEFFLDKKTMTTIVMTYLYCYDRQQAISVYNRYKESKRCKRIKKIEKMPELV